MCVQAKKVQKFGVLIPKLFGIVLEFGRQIFRDTKIALILKISCKEINKCKSYYEFSEVR